MAKRPRVPSPRAVRDALHELRRFIDEKRDARDEEQKIAARMAYVAETAIRWVTESTDWSGPLAEARANARILVRELAERREAR